MISSVDMRKLVDPVLRPRYSPQRKLRTVVIDPGHGGHDAGAVSPIAKEKDLNLAVARRLRKLLQNHGFRVVMTRDADYFLTLQQRVEIANRIPDSVFVSIHHNAGRSAASGIETFTLAPQGTTSPFARSRCFEDLAGNNQDSENIALATAVHSRAIRSSGAIDRGIQRARFSVLCTIRRPAILFEGGFVSNPEECAKMATSAYQTLLADSICKGIVAYNNTVCRPAQKVATANAGSVRLRTSISGSQLRTQTPRK
jgi:N-acetylmuramoyl-L-alanine amidase